VNFIEKAVKFKTNMMYFIGWLCDWLGEKQRNTERGKKAIPISSIDN
jgi:hypothetical protein